MICEWKNFLKLLEIFRWNKKKKKHIYIYIFFSPIDIGYARNVTRYLHEDNVKWIPKNGWKSENRNREQKYTRAVRVVERFHECIIIVPDGAYLHTCYYLCVNAWSPPLSRFRAREIFSSEEIDVLHAKCTSFPSSQCCPSDSPFRMFRVVKTALKLARVEREGR